ncbi:MAG: NosD domain-containing protein, partial [Candidatus Thorarchaeota archaeon]
MRRLMLGLFTFFILLSSTTWLFSYISVPPHREPNRFTVSQGIELTEHDPISITDDSQFSEMGFPGSGTNEDPYVIDDLVIVDEDSCIRISGTISFFTIRNCFLTCPNAGVIQLENVYNGIIEDCRIEGGEFGISFRNCGYIEIVGTIISGSLPAGIKVSDSNYNISISHNRIFGCETGIFVENTENCIIHMNRIYYNRFGIHLVEDTYNNIITQNSLGWNNNQGNRFGDNIDGGNAHDSGSNNYWDGNSWSDYRSWYVWYEIGGGSDPQDLPRDLNPSSLFDLSSPVITISEIDIVIEGNSSAFLSWTINEEFPVSFELYQNT